VVKNATTAAPPSPPSPPPPPTTPKRTRGRPAPAPAPDAPKISRNADRGLVLREAARIDCPACMASPGAPCFDDDDGTPKERPSYHPDRLGAARAKLDGVKRRMGVRCPVCDAPEHTPCVVDGRRGLHKERGA
jgi:hypothetical protein